MLGSLAKHKWSSISIGLSVSVLLLTTLTGAYYGGEVPQPPRALGVFDLLAMPVSFVVGCVALGKEMPRRFAITALVLSVLGFFCVASS